MRLIYIGKYYWIKVILPKHFVQFNYINLNS